MPWVASVFIEERKPREARAPARSMLKCNAGGERELPASCPQHRPTGCFVSGLASNAARPREQSKRSARSVPYGSAHSALSVCGLGIAIARSHHLALARPPACVHAHISITVACRLPQPRKETVYGT